MLPPVSRIPRLRNLPVVLLLAVSALALHPAAFASNKKKQPQPAAEPAAGPRKFPFDPKTLAWPSPPALPRIHWLDYFAGQPIDFAPDNGGKPKASWMDRLAGVQSDAEKANSKKLPFQLI